MFLRRHLLRWSALLLAALFALHTFAADAPVPADNDAYNGALNHVRISDRITALEIFATNHRNSPLAEDALEFALWYYLSTGGRARTMDVAAQLLRVNPENPLALSVLAHDRRSAAEGNLDVERNLRETERMTNTGLKALNFMRHPQGMTDADFTAMKRQVIALLEGDAGYIALHNKRYDHAQLLLKNSVDADPESPQNVYALSLAYLNSPKPNRKEGYWYLARSVNLTQGTPAGEQIAQFASAQYRHDGGTPQDWNQFLVATRVPAPPATATPAAQVEVAKAEPPRNSAPTTPAPSQTTITTTPRDQRPTAPPAQVEVAKSEPPRNSAPTTPAPSQTTITATTRDQLPDSDRDANKSDSDRQTKTRDTSDRDRKKRDEQQTLARADVPKDLPPAPADVPPIDEGKRHGKSSKDDYSSGIWKSPSADTPPAPGPIYKRPANGSPVSLGILIESAHLSKGERDALVRGITGILDDLRDSDEAFILTYGDELTFEQDLTHQPWLLQDAMSHLKSRGGDQALYDAIATSAAHLRRIAKNQNRVLLLVSDGENNAKNKRGLDLGWSVREVTVHCMGVDVSRDEDRRFLEALASRTGGHTVFVHDVQEFPEMSAQMARNIYGPPMR